MNQQYARILLNIPGRLLKHMLDLKPADTGPDEWWGKFIFPVRNDYLISLNSIRAGFEQTPFVVIHAHQTNEDGTQYVCVLIRPRRDHCKEIKARLEAAGLPADVVQLMDDSFAFIQGAQVYRVKYRGPIEFWQKDAIEAKRNAVAAALGKEATMLLATPGADDDGVRSLRILFTFEVPS
jgi:hypothetical protein